MRYVIAVVIVCAFVIWDAMYNNGSWLRWFVLQMTMLIRWMGL